MRKPKKESDQPKKEGDKLENDQQKNEKQLNAFDKNSAIKRAAETQSREKEKQLIFKLTEEKVEKDLDKFFDREKEKIELINGSEIDLAEISRNLTLSPQAYAPVAEFKAFWTEIYIKMGLPVPEKFPYKKPPIIGKITNEVIYERFSREVLPTLQKLNPYIHQYRRKFKHHQFFTPDEGLKNLKRVLTEATEMMREYDEWYDFRINYARDYGLTFQLNAFEELKRKGRI